MLAAADYFYTFIFTEFLFHIIPFALLQYLLLSTPVNYHNEFSVTRLLILFATLTKIRATTASNKPAAVAKP